MSSGTEILKKYNQRINQAYMQNEGTDRKQLRINRAALLYTQELINDNYLQRHADLLTHVNVVNRSYKATLGKVLLSSNIVLAIVPSATSSTIHFEYEHLLAVGDTFTIKSNFGTGAFNGTYTVVSVPSDKSVVILQVLSTGYVSGSAYADSDQWVTDYMQLKVCRCIAKRQVARFKKIVFTNKKSHLMFGGPSRLRAGSKIYITGTGALAADGYYYVRPEGLSFYELFKDRFMNDPVTSVVGVVSNDVTVYEIISEVSTEMKSHRKGSPFHVGTYDQPKHELSRKLLITHPEADSVELDYYSNNIIQFDLTDAVTDYSLFANQKFIETVIDRAASDFYSTSNELQKADYKNREQTILNP